VLGNDEGGDIAKPQPGQQRADDGGKNDRHDGRKSIVAEHDLVGEDRAGDRGVERGRNGAGHAAGEQDAPGGIRQVETLANRRTKGRTEMDDRPFAAGARARTERQGGDRGRRYSRPEGQLAPALDARLHDIGDAECALFRLDSLKQDADDEAADDRGEKDHDEGNSGGGADHGLGSSAEPRQLHEADGFTKHDCRDGDDEADHRCQQPDKGKAAGGEIAQVRARFGQRGRRLDP
jgi:hypothetical protein